MNRDEALKVVLDYAERMREHQGEAKVDRAIAVLRSDGWDDDLPDALTLPFGATVPDRNGVDCMALRPMCLVMGGTYFHRLDTSAQIRGLLQPVPALVKHETLRATSPVERLAEMPDRPGRMQADGLAYDALGRVSFSLLAGYDPGSIAWEAARMVRAAIDLGEDSRESLGLG